MPASFLFVCVGNAGRSQMAEALAGKGGLDAFSAGAMLIDCVNPTVVQAMPGVRIDLSDTLPRMLTAETITNAIEIFPMGRTVEEAGRIGDELERRGSELTWYQFTTGSLLMRLLFINRFRFVCNCA